MRGTNDIVAEVVSLPDAEVNRILAEVFKRKRWLGSWFDGEDLDEFADRIGRGDIPRAAWDSIVASDHWNFAADRMLNGESVRDHIYDAIEDGYELWLQQQRQQQEAA